MVGNSVQDLTRRDERIAPACHLTVISWARLAMHRMTCTSRRHHLQELLVPLQRLPSIIRHRKRESLLSIRVALVLVDRIVDLAD